MEIGLDSPLLQFDGSPIFKDSSGVPFTIKDVLLNVLGNFSQGTGEEKIHAYSLGMRVFEGKQSMTFLEADLQFIVNRMKDSGYPALIVGQVIKMLDESKK